MRPATLILPTLPQRNLRQANMIYGPTQAVKEGLCMMGLPIGDLRHPIMPGGGFKREDRKELRLQLEALGKLAPAILRYDLGNRQVETQVAATPQTPRSISLIIDYERVALYCFGQGTT